jgi:glycosyltransferase involved in cell wall biosynthesis
MDVIKMRSFNIDIIILTHEYPPYIFGGVATYNKNVAEWLAQKGWRVLVISGKSSLTEKIICRETNSNLSVCRIYLPEVPPRWFIYGLIIHEYLKNLLKKVKQKVIIIANGLNSWLVFRGIKDLRNRCRLVTIFHGSLYAPLIFYSSIFHLKDLIYAFLSSEESLYFLETPLLNFLIRNDLCISDYNIFVAKHVLYEFKQLYKDLSDKIREGEVVYPGIEFEELNKLKQDAKREAKDEIIVAFIGRLFYSKGITHVVKAMEYLIKELRERKVKLWIFGRGSLETWLKWYIKKAQLLNHVKLFGFVSRHRLLSILAKYVDVSLHPSLYEAAPLAVIESQALGIPVVTYDLPWAQEFILNGVSGYRAPYADIPALAKYILKALDLDKDKIVFQAQRYDKERSFRKLQDVLNELSSNY